MMKERDLRKHVAMGKRFRSLSSFHCCGVHPNWEDYSTDEAREMEEAEIIFYPTSLYEELFLSLGKRIFPRNYYRFMGNKIRQTQLFQLLGVPHPRTRLYYGRERAGRILADFRFPFVGKTPIGSSKGEGVFLISDEVQLRSYLSGHFPAYIQEFLPVDRDLRVVVIGGRAVHSYWRIPKNGEFRNNVSQGARISFENIPSHAVDLAEDVARRCRFDEVGLDICIHGGVYYIIEANMVFGLEGFRRAGLELPRVFLQLEREGVF